jgi:hypothetical protein
MSARTAMLKGGDFRQVGGYTNLNYRSYDYAIKVSKGYSFRLIRRKDNESKTSELHTGRS